MSTDTKRLQFVDMVKGLAILSVVFYHILAPTPVRTFLSHIMEICLVSFFFFSGYFHRPGKKTLGQNLKARAKSLLTPLFKYSIFFWIVGTIYLVATGGAPFYEALCCLRNFFGGCIWNRTLQGWFGWEYYSLGKRYFFLADFWFLIAMMLASILFFLVVDRVVKSAWKTIVAAAAMFAVTGILRGFAIDLPYNLQLIPFWCAFMILGAFAGNNGVFESKKLSGAAEWILGLLSLAVGIAIAVIRPESSNLYRGSFPENEVINMLFCITASLLATWGLGIVCKKIEQAGVRVKELAWLGSHSLVIYIYHMFFAWIICTISGFSIFYPEDPGTGTIAWSVLLAVACLTLCILRYAIGDALAAKFSKKAASKQ